MINKNVPLKLPPNALAYKLSQAVIISIILSIVAKFYPETSSYYLLLGLGLLILSGIYTFAYVSLFSYVIGSDAITVNSGVLFRSEKIINYNDLQNVDVQRGPLLMLFGLSNLRGFTASPGQLMISSDDHGHTSTTVTPDVQILLTKQDGEELAQIMRAGHIQKVQQVQNS